MSARARLRRSAAVALVSAITAGSALLLTACDPSAQATAPKPGSAAPAGTTGSPSAPGSATPSASASSSGTPSAPASAPATPSSPASAPADRPTATPTEAALNLTKGTGLTISNGTRYVVMDGRTVDFGTVVRDLAWSPDGKHAAFIDGAGNLQTSNPDGSHKVLIAKAPTGVTWSHPTWQVTTPDQFDKGRTNLIFTADDHGTLRLLRLPAQAGATPDVISLNPYSDENPKLPPTTGNRWPSSTGAHGRIVYANKDDGQVYLRDDYLRQNGGPVTKGSQPAADDEGDLVFVRSVDGHSHIFASHLNQANPDVQDLTPGAVVDFTEPVISHDGRTVAFRGPDGIYTAPTRGGKPQKVSDTVGLPAFRS
ncbi:hypothetical protein ACFV1L_13955 [Kitasatospora sp. NPDC059646]|uniref:hypothetical protein n=1 Tax=Kitasatospora sp. NPDC059646 TaxID=3346893 RepID=UPI00369EF22F